MAGGGNFLGDDGGGQAATTEAGPFGRNVFDPGRQIVHIDAKNLVHCYILPFVFFNPISFPKGRLRRFQRNPSAGHHQGFPLRRSGSEISRFVRISFPEAKQ